MKKFWASLGKGIVKYLPALLEAVLVAKAKEKRDKDDPTASYARGRRATD